MNLIIIQIFYRNNQIENFLFLTCARLKYDVLMTLEPSKNDLYLNASSRNDM